MSDHSIHLLPPHVTNQIAAGEVIQRPANVLKELMENAVDAGANQIQVLIKDGGKTLIQVIDNGSGMNELDAELCFERHATSKLSKVEDLFNIGTKGFRGEAMASIASIAHVELKTKKANAELGTSISLEGGKIINKESCQAETGTNVSVKNLFFNVPARRKFLKSDAVETKHLLDEFTRVALIHHDVQFSLYQDNTETYQLPPSNFKQRIIALFGKSFRERLVPIEEETDIIKISGFIVKPDHAKKTRGEQFFFANNRFIKHGYFHHAVSNCFEDLISAGAHPSYFIKLEVNPQEIDLNIHPTKIEVKFSEERFIYAILTAAIKKALNQYNLAPTLDFNQENSFDSTPINWDKPIQTPEIKVDKSFNPFKSNENQSWSKGEQFQRKRNNEDWEKLYKQDQSDESSNLLNDYMVPEDSTQTMIFEESELSESEKFYQQLQSKYILTEDKSGLIIINQKRAHERILFEHFIHAFQEKHNSSQQLLFPESIEFSPKEAVILEELLPDLQKLGFDINLFGKNTYVINGVPSDLKDNDSKELIENVVSNYQEETGKTGWDLRTKLAKALAQKLAIRSGQKLVYEEMKTLCEQLFLCENPLSSPSGKPILSTYPFKMIDKQLT